MYCDGSGLHPMTSATPATQTRPRPMRSFTPSSLPSARRADRCFSIRDRFPPAEDATLREQRPHAFQIFRHLRHHLFRETRIVETFIGVVEKPASQERMLQKLPARPAHDFERP